MQLVAPVRVLAVLELEPLGQGRGQRHLAAVFAHGAAQDADGVVVLAPRRVVPALDGDGRELDVAVRSRDETRSWRQGRGWPS